MHPANGPCSQRGCWAGMRPSRGIMLIKAFLYNCNHAGYERNLAIVDELSHCNVGGASGHRATQGHRL